jgi:hypothetical protein
MRLIVTKRGEYLLPISAAVEWEERHPGMTRPKWAEGGRYWRTPDGLVFARMEDETQAH